MAGKDGIWTIAPDSYAVKSGVNPSEKYVIILLVSSDFKGEIFISYQVSRIQLKQG